MRITLTLAAALRNSRSGQRALSSRAVPLRRRSPIFMSKVIAHPRREIVMTRPTIRNTRARLGLALAIVAAGPTLAHAQDSLLKQGQGLLGGVLQSSPGGGGSAASGLGAAQIGDGLREALRIGSERVTASLGQVDGFNTNPDVHIPLPDQLETVQSALAMVGMSGLADDLELRMNRAAETAAPEAQAMFVDAISAMTLEDAQGILNGPDDAATRYFQGKMSGPLTERFTPVVNRELADAGAVQSYQQMMGDYDDIPFMPSVEADLTPYVVQQALDGMFLLLAREEFCSHRS
jgi:hypothetical protein